MAVTLGVRTGCPYGITRTVGRPVGSILGARTTRARGPLARRPTPAPARHHAGPSGGWVLAYRGAPGQPRRRTSHMRACRIRMPHPMQWRSLWVPAWGAPTGLPARWVARRIHPGRPHHLGPRASGPAPYARARPAPRRPFGGWVLAYRGAPGQPTRRTSHKRACRIRMPYPMLLWNNLPPHWRAERRAPGARHAAPCRLATSRAVRDTAQGHHVARGGAR
jgi:hypothetical protein